MKKAQVHVLGVGEAFSSDSGNTGFWFEAPSSTTPSFLVDCGYQIPERFWRRRDATSRGVKRRELDAVFLTHLHADHAFGLVPLLVRFWEEKRRRSLWIGGPRGVRPYVERLMALGYPGLLSKLGFPIEYHEWESGKVWQFRGVTIRCALTRHSVPNYCLRFEGKSFSFSVSGDGALTPRVAHLIQGVRLHFQECYTVKPLFPTHAALSEILPIVLAEDAGGPQVCLLTHLQRAEKGRVERVLKKQAPKGIRLGLASEGRTYSCEMTALARSL